MVKLGILYFDLARSAHLEMGNVGICIMIKKVHAHSGMGRVGICIVM